VFGEHATHDILVEVHAERMRDLLRDAHTAELGIAAFEFHDRRDECHGRAFGTGLAARGRGRKEPAVFPIHQRVVEFEQRSRAKDHRNVRDTARAHELGGEAEDDAIERGEIRGTPSAAIVDQQLMFEEQRLRGEGAGATLTEEFREGDKQVDDEDQKFAHERTLPPPLSGARLPGTGGFLHTTNSHPTRWE
jgi:hypothetical protein